MTNTQLFKQIVSHRFKHRILIVVLSLATCCLGLSAPLFQKRFIDGISNTPDYFSHFFSLTPMAAIFCAFGCILFSFLLNTLLNFIGSREAILMQQILARQVYEKNLSLKNDSMSRLKNEVSQTSSKSVGEMVSLYAVDVPGSTMVLEQTLPMGASILFPIILAPLALKMLFGIPIWPCVVCIGAIGLINFIMGLVQSRFFYRFKKLAAERVGLVNEWIQNIRALRVLGWMAEFEEKILGVRKIETTNRVAMVTNGQIMNSVGSSITFFINIIAIYALINSSNKNLTHGDLLAVLWITAVFLIKPFRQMPWLFTFLFDGWTSISRVATFLNVEGEEELQPALNHALTSDKHSLEVKNLNLSIGSKNILKDISFKIKDGEFVCIVGEVASGKTSLLLSLLKENHGTFESYKLGTKSLLEGSLQETRKTFTLVPQDGFIMSASLRENIVFEYDVSKGDDSHIDECLRDAQFLNKIENIENGLETQIGERGVNLSGGQKQRINIARAVYYSKRPVVLLDDCLSALDVDTEKKIVDQLILGTWKNKTRILVTHRLSVLEQCDRVLFMKNGRIQNQGTLAEILKVDEDFRTFLNSKIVKSQFV